MNKSLSQLLILCFIITQSYSQSQADSAFYNTPKSQWLKKKTGVWSVTNTIQPAPDAKPTFMTGIEAERTTVGAFFLHETMHSNKGANMPLFQRNADLDWNYNDARWDYISIDSRVTAGIMLFTNIPDIKDSIVSIMPNSVHPGFGPEHKYRGMSMRVKNVVITIDDNHDMVKPYWKLTDGDEWQAKKKKQLK